MPTWRERADNFCEHGILCLVVALLVIGPLLLGGAHAEFFAVMAGLGVAALLLWVVRLWVAPEPTVFWPPLAWVVVAALGYALVRGHYAVLEYTTLGELLRLGLCGVVFFVVLNNLGHRHTAGWVTGALMAVAAFGAMYAIFQALTRSSQVWHFARAEGYIGRGSGTYICPNHLAGLLEMALPLGLALLFLGRIGHMARIVTGYAVLVMVAGLAATQSRGGWVATALALLVFFAVLLRQRGLRVPALLLLLMLGGAAVWFIAEVRVSSERIRQALGDEQLNDVRLYIWPVATRIWHEHFWWGAGPGHFDPLFRQFRSLHVQARPDRVHNDYLNLLTDYGLVGMIIALFMLGLIAWTILRVWPHVQREGDDFRAQQSNRAAFVLGAGTGVLALLFHAFVDFNFHMPANVVAFTALVALLAGHLRHTPQNFRVPLHLLGRGAVTVAALAVAVVLGHAAARRGLEEHLLRRASDPRTNRDEQFALLQQAHALEPTNPDTHFALGEVLRVTAWEMPPGQQDGVRAAMPWFESVWRLNPYDPFSRLRYGMCLDLLGERESATRHFLRALELDPVGAFTLSHVGWHYIQLEDWANARKYLRRAAEMPGADYTIPNTYLPVVEERLTEQERRTKAK
ncbi:MAG: hypothetical protein FJ406_11295 [Verrucomicrobia bacterium]|nr:hypothetical protein [Verrucomicrobiota bacterium]